LCELQFVQVEVDFDDHETYECLFKEYWADLKSRLSLIIPELDKDGKAVEGTNAVLQNGGSDTEDHSENDESGADTDKESDHDDLETLDSSRRKRLKRKSVTLDPENIEGDAEQEDAEDDDEDYDKSEVQPREIDGWASKELLDFVEYMKEDRAKPLTKFAVNKLLWVYIKRHKLQDSRTKSQINCDERLQKIFGKESVGQFEMFKHLQAHYPEKGPVGSKKEKEDVNGDDLMLEDDPSAADNVDSKLSRGKDRRRGRRSIDEKFERPDSNDFVAITPKNIGLIYLRRALLEDLLDDPEFENKVVDTFVRIRVPGMSSKSEMCYRLVLVTGDFLAMFLKFFP
jgi:chromatin remodeling complex protein RSC6